jgi:hypothetical protein
MDIPRALITAPPSVSAGGAMGSCDHSAVRVMRMLAVGLLTRLPRFKILGGQIKALTSVVTSEKKRQIS